MSAPTVTPANVNSTRFKIILLLAAPCLLMGGSYALGRRAGAADQRKADLEAAAQAAHVFAQQQVAKSDAAQRASQTVVEHAQTATARHVQTVAKTDTALQAAEAAKRAAEAAAADSAASADRLRAVLDSVVVADSALQVSFLGERAAANAAIDSLTAAVNAQIRTIAEKNASIAALTNDRAQLAKVVSELQSEQHGWFHRGMVSLGGIAAGGLCGGIGWLASPLVGVGAAVACSFTVGVINP